MVALRVTEPALPSDERFVRGIGDFVDDMRRPGELSLSVVRSVFAHGVIRAIDVEQARSMPGVRAVLTAADLDVVPTIPIRTSPTRQMENRLQPVIAAERVRYVGEPIAVVVADSPALAESAAESVFDDIEPLPPVSEATRIDAQAMWQDGRDNVLTDLTVRHGQIRSEGRLTIEAEFVTGRHTGFPLEPRGLVAEWEGNILHIWGVTKFIHFTKDSLAMFFGIPRPSVVCHRVDIGGMFGVRGELYPEHYLVPWAASVTGHPIRWIERRREHLVAVNQAGKQHHLARLVVSHDGNFVSLHDDVHYDMGAYPRPIGGRVTEIILETLPGPYRWEGLDLRCRGVASTRTPVGTVRGPAAGETAFVRERMIDMAAGRLGLDPLELRRRNLIVPDEIPHRQQLGWGDHDPIFDGGDYPAILDGLVDRVGYRSIAAEVGRRREKGESVGVGWGLFVIHSGLGGKESIGLELAQDGRFILRTSTADVGQGLERMARIVASRALSVEKTLIDVISGDSRAHPEGRGTFASRTTLFVANAVMDASNRLLEAAANRAAAMLGTTPELLQRTPDGFAADEVELVWKELAPFSVPGRHVMNQPTYGFGAHVAVVAIDAESGDIRVERVAVGYDCGTVIDRPSTLGQMVGGAAMGIGMALYEVLPFDEHNQPQATTLMEYVVPNSRDIPVIDAFLFESGSTIENPVGTKGVGEAGVIGVSAAVANALADALGIPDAQVVSRLPIDRWSVLRSAGRSR